MNAGVLATLLPAGLARRFARAFVGLVAIALAVNGAISMWLSYEEATASAVGVQREKALAAAERVAQFIGEIEGQIGWTTRAEWARVPAEQRRYDFIRLLRQAPAVTEALYIDGQGREQLRLSRLEPDVVGSGADLSSDPRFARAVADKVWYGPVYFRRGSEPYMTLSLAHAGRTPGVTSVGVNLKLVWDVITAVRVGEQGYAYVTDAAGKLIAHPDMSLVLRDTDLSRLPQVAAAIRVGSDKTGSGTRETVKGPDGRDVLSASAPVPKLGWYVFVELPRREVLAPVLASFYQTLALLGLGTLMALLLGGWLARRMAAPIQALEAGAQKLGAGDLSQRVAVASGDEIGRLAERFNVMAERIQEAQETLEQKVEDRTHELTESLGYQTATSEVLAVISRSTSDAQPVFEAIVKSAAKLFAPWTANISIVRDGMLHFLASASTLRADEKDIVDQAATIYPLPFDPERAPSARAIVERRTIELLDTARPDTPEYSSKVQAATGIRSMTFVPLLREGDGIGTIILTRREPGHRLTEKQHALVQTFADQAVIAIENARLFQELQSRTRELSDSLEYQTAITEVLGVISRSPSAVQPIFNTIVATAARLCHADQAFFMKFDEGVAVAVASSNDQSDLAQYMKNNPVPLHPGTMTGRVVAENRTVHIPDCLADKDYGATAHQKVAGYRTMLGVPLLRMGVAIGSISLLRIRVEPFTDRQIALVETFADQAMIAIENARLFDELQARTTELQQSLDDLRAAQDRLVQTEKLASLGQLTAGIAHEIKNPLNFVNNFSELSVELVDELEAALATAGPALDPEIRAETTELAATLRSNLSKVVQHGKRADSIVKNMLAHSREGGGERRPIDLNATVDEALNLAYHGARAEKPGFNVALERDYDKEAGSVELYPQEFTRVLLNLIGNGFHAAQKKAREAEAGVNGPAFQPTLRVSTRARPDRIEIRVRDNGTGIPPAVKAHIFEPFFTTKPAGEGTGLGLSLSHDIIVKQHGGSIDVATEPGAFTEFTISLPTGAPPARRRS